VSTHDYKGHTIRVDTLEGVRPWAVWVDGALVYGNGDRVRRRLAYSTAAAALDAGKKHVRVLLAALPCAHCHHARSEHRIPYETNLSMRCAIEGCTCFAFQFAGKPLLTRRDFGTMQVEPSFVAAIERFVENGRAAQQAVDKVVAQADVAAQPNLYPCGCSKHKVNAGRCTSYKPGELP